MSDRLVTVASFDRPAQAHVAKNVLEAAGIRAVVTDEETAGMLWHISPALSGAKVQVMEEDAERSLALLEKELGPDDGGPVDQDQFAAEAEAAAPEEGVAPPPAAEPAPTSAPTADSARAADEEAPSERDEYARRLFLASVFSLVIFPLWFYAVYLFLNAAFGEGPISERGRSHLRRSGVIVVIGFFLVWVVVLLI